MNHLAPPLSSKLAVRLVFPVMVTVVFASVRDAGVLPELTVQLLKS